MLGFRHALRSLSRTPAFTTTVMASIGLTVGLACSVFAVVNATFFGRLPYPDPERLLELWQTASPGSSQVQDYLQPRRMIEWLGADTRHLEAIAGSGMGPTLIVSNIETPRRVEAAPVVGDWFAVMGVPAARGRLLTDEDRDPAAERALVVSERFAQEHDVDVGSAVELSEIGYTVVGVMPPEFDARPRVWMTVESLPETLQPAAYAGVARIRVGSSLDEAVLEVEQMAAAQVAVDSARYAGLGATARTFGATARSPSRPRLWLLVGVTGAVILIGISNLTQLFLLRSRAQRRDLAVRAALGGRTWQIGRPLAVEAALLTAGGLVLGLGLTAYGTGVVQGLLGGEYALPSDASLGLPVAAFGIILTLLLAGFVGGEPLRHLGSLDIQSLLQRRAAGAVTTPAERRTQRVMVAAQVAICVVLAAVATVLGTAYAALGGLDVGYDASNVVQAVVDYEMAGLEEPEQWELARRVAERISVHPAVSAVGVWQLVGQAYPPRPESNAVIDGAPSALGRFERLYRYYQVESGFFDALGVEFVAGRVFTSADGPGQPPVAVVTQPGAAAWWPGESPLGRRIKIGEQGTWMTIVGVVEHVQDLDALGRTIALNGQRMPLLFVPARQLPTAPPGWGVNARGRVMIGARPSRSSEAAAEALRAEITTAAPTLPVTAVGTMQRLQMTRGYSGRWLALNGKLAGAGVAVTLLLALLGIVGVVLEGLGRRTREIGLRIALGARARAVILATARESLIVAVAGIALGLGSLLVLDGLLSRVVFSWEVQRLALGVLHPGILAVAATAVTLVACATSVIAAGRAAGIDPAVALRSD